MSSLNQNQKETPGETNVCSSLMSLIRDERYHRRLSGMILETLQTWLPDPQLNIQPEAELLAALIFLFYSTSQFTKGRIQSLGMEFLGLSGVELVKNKSCSDCDVASKWKKVLLAQLLFRYLVQNSKRSTNVDHSSIESIAGQVRGSSRQQLFHEHRRKMIERGTFKNPSEHETLTSNEQPSTSTLSNNKFGVNGRDLRLEYHQVQYRARSIMFKFYSQLISKTNYFLRVSMHCLYSFL